MNKNKRIITLDSNIFIAALKIDEYYNEKCIQILNKIPDIFLLSEPSIVYQEVCGTLAKKVGEDIAEIAKKQLDLMIHPKLLINCDKSFYISSYPLCSKYRIYAINALYFKTALDNRAILVSLDKENFIDKVKSNGFIEAYHISEFPY